MLPEEKGNYYGNLPKELKELTLEQFVSITISPDPNPKEELYILVTIEISLGNKVIFKFRTGKAPNYGRNLLDHFLQDIAAKKEEALITSYDDYELYLLYFDKFSVIIDKENEEFIKLDVEGESTEGIPEYVRIPIVEIDKALSDILLRKLKLVNEDIKANKFINIYHLKS